MRRFLIMLFSMIVLSVSTEAKNKKVSAPDFVGRTACGISLVAENGENAFTKVGRKDLCLIQKLIHQQTGVRVRKTWVYLVSFEPWRWRQLPAIVKGFKRNHLHIFSFFFAPVEGYYYGEGVVQINPSVFDSQTYWKDSALTAPTSLAFEKWYGAMIIAHELLHHALSTHGVPIAVHHCEMTYPPHAHWTTIMRTSAPLYGVTENDAEALIRHMKRFYLEQCKHGLVIH